MWLISWLVHDFITKISRGEWCNIFRLINYLNKEISTKLNIFVIDNKLILNIIIFVLIQEISTFL